MHKILFASMMAASLVSPALAQDAGTIKLHSGWKLIQERVDKGVAYGTLWAITFNDAGSGPLHMAPASGTYNLTQETGKGEGELTWGDGDDQLKGSFSITVSDGKARNLAKNFSTTSTSAWSGARSPRALCTSATHTRAT